MDSDEGVADSVDTASSKDFSDAKDDSYFDTAKDEAAVDTAENFAASKDAGSTNNVTSVKDMAPAEGVVASIGAAADKIFTDVKYYDYFDTTEDDTAIDTTEKFAPNKDAGSDNVVASAKDAASAKGVASSIVATTSDELVSAKDADYFDTSEDNVTFDTSKNLAGAKDAGSSNDVASAGYSCSVKVVAASVDASAVIFSLFFDPTYGESLIPFL